MARQKKNTTPAMNELAQRLDGMRSIDPHLDLGKGVSVAAGDALLADETAAITTYNVSLAVADENKNNVDAQDKLVKAFIKKILPAVGLEYGTDSNEYEKVGGTRESERKKPVRKPKNPTS